MAFKVVKHGAQYFLNGRKSNCPECGSADTYWATATGLQKDGLLCTCRRCRCEFKITRDEEDQAVTDGECPTTDTVNLKGVPGPRVQGDVAGSG